LFRFCRNNLFILYDIYYSFSENGINTRPLSSASVTFGYIDMVSDPETGYLYTGDGVYMMCLKPPK